MTLVLADLRIRLGGRTVLSVDRLVLQPGELTVVVGPNGAGKSTLLRVASGELPPTAGGASLHGRRLADWHPRDLARNRAVLPQASQLGFPFTVYEVVSLGLTASERSVPTARRRARVARSLARAGLSDYAGRFYQELSGGEQQRVQFARVLCQLPDEHDDSAPRWLMLDEPTSSLDLKHQFAILDEARRHVQAGGGVLAILHDLNLATLYADRLVVLSQGRVRRDGRGDEGLSEDLVEEVFGVRLRLARSEGGRQFLTPERLSPSA